MRIKAIVALPGLLGILTGAAVLAAPAASASGGVCNPGCSANVEFASTGEIFTVHDYDSDGHSTVGLIDIKQNGSWVAYDTVWNTKGFDAPPVTRNYSLAEGTSVRYAACLGESGSGVIFDCSGWKTDKA